MAKNRMPEPVAFRSKDTPYLFSLGGPETEGFEGLVTTSQAEAYADARVREALEDVCRMVARYSTGGNPGSERPKWARDIAEAIGAIIPKETT